MQKTTYSIVATCKRWDYNYENLITSYYLYGMSDIIISGLLNITCHLNTSLQPITFNSKKEAKIAVEQLSVRGSYNTVFQILETTKLNTFYNTLTY